MTPEQALNILQQRVWNVKDSQGMCGSRGFWYDDSSDMLVYEDRISMLAHKRGKELKDRYKNVDNVVVFEKKYYKYDFVFNKVSSIVVYDDPLVLPTFPTCNKKDMKGDYLIIDLFIDKLNNFKFIILEEDFDKTMAALTILLPSKPVKIK